MNEALLGMISARCGQTVKMLITIETQGIFGSNLAYSSI